MLEEGLGEPGRRGAGAEGDIGRRHGRAHALQQKRFCTGGRPLKQKVDPALRLHRPGDGEFHVLESHHQVHGFQDVAGRHPGELVLHGRRPHQVAPLLRQLVPGGVACGLERDGDHALVHQPLDVLPGGADLVVLPAPDFRRPSVPGVVFPVIRAPQDLKIVRHQYFTRCPYFPWVKSLGSAPLDGSGSSGGSLPAWSFLNM